jgi:integrase
VSRLDPNTVYDLFVRTVKAAGLSHVKLHLLRHIAASLLIAVGVDIAIVSKRLGHSRIGITMDTYGHLIGKAGRRAAKAAAKIVPRAGRPKGDYRPKNEGKKKSRKSEKAEA